MKIEKGKGKMEGGEVWDGKWRWRRTGDTAGAVGRIVRGNVVAMQKQELWRTGGKEGGRKEGWRVVMMDVLLSFRAP